MTREEQFALLEKYAPGTEVVFLDIHGAAREGVVIGPIIFADDLDLVDAFPQFTNPPAEGSNEPYILPVVSPRDGDGEPVPAGIRWEKVVGVKE